MQGRYPRTVREFAENGRVVVVRCAHYGRVRRVPPDVLERYSAPTSTSTTAMPPWWRSCAATSATARAG
jgi:hypothetical protein